MPFHMRKLSGYGPSIIVLITAAVVLFAGPRAVQQLTYEHTRTRVIQARHSLHNTDILQQINQAYRDIATIVEPSVVHISARYTEQNAMGITRPGISTGSGWVFDEEGHIVTNHHVILNAERIDVQLYNGSLREATLVGADPTTDIAVIKVAPGLLHPADLAELDTVVSQGDLVFAFGSPFDFRFSMSSGVVSGKDRSVGVIRDADSNRPGYENFIQVDAAINPGNSGGPLTDYRGRVIGMNTAIATGLRRYSTEEGQFAGIGLAIPLDMIYPVVTQLIKNGFVEKGFLGVQPSELMPATARQQEFSGTGVYIVSVEAEGPAGRSGVRAKDIVTHVGGRPIATVPQLRSLVSSMMPGKTTTLTIWRYDPDTHAKRTLELEVPLDKLDTLRVDGRLPPDQPLDSVVPLGILRMASNTPLLAAQLGIDFRPGVVIQDVAAESVLARRLVPGTVVVAVRDKPVRTVQEFIEALRNHDLRRSVQIEGYDLNGRRYNAYLQSPP